MVKINPVKQLIKRSLQILAARLGPHTRTTGAPQLIVLMYHRVLPMDDVRCSLEEPGMVVSPATFRRNLEIISQYFEFVKLSDWLEKKNQGQPLPRRACAITFDDGWADNYEYAFPILKEMGIPATIFLVSDMIGTTDRFWPERLANVLVAIAEQKPGQWGHPCLDWLRGAATTLSLAQGAPGRDEISRLIATAKKYPDEDIHHRLDVVIRELGLQIEPAAPSLLDWSQVNKMSASGLIEFGSHTCRHIRLGNQTPVEVIRHQVTTSKQHIEAHSVGPVRTFCFPNGDYCDSALGAVKKTYIGAVTTHRGWNSAATDCHMLNRIGVHEDIAKDKTAFLARISGWI